MMRIIGVLACSVARRACPAQAAVSELPFRSRITRLRTAVERNGDADDEFSPDRDGFPVADQHDHRAGCVLCDEIRANPRAAAEKRRAEKKTSVAARPKLSSAGAASALRRAHDRKTVSPHRQLHA